MQQAAQELCRAIRGHRSQVAFARRLGYRGHAIANWEAGRRSPAITEVLRAAALVGIDVPGSFRDFEPRLPAPADPTDFATVVPWLQGLRGRTSQKDLARAMGISRHRVGRWLRGEAVPRVHEFLTLVHALSGGRAADWVAKLVPADQVPSLAPWFRRTRLIQNLVADQPWVSLIRPLVRVLHPLDPDTEIQQLAAQVGIPESQMAEAVAALESCGLIQRHGGVLTVDGGFTMDLASTPEARKTLKSHWSTIGSKRIDAPRTGDLFSFNVFTASHDLVARLRDLQRSYFRQVRALVGESAQEPDQVVVMNVHLFAFGHEPTP
ncbi:MAG: DUF4423 domain-containing protein [Myxococcota bacterium]